MSLNWRLECSCLADATRCFWRLTDGCEVWTDTHSVIAMCYVVLQRLRASVTWPTRTLLCAGVIMLEVVRLTCGLMFTCCYVAGQQQLSTLSAEVITGCFDCGAGLRVNAENCMINDTHTVFILRRRALTCCLTVSDSRTIALCYSHTPTSDRQGRYRAMTSSKVRALRSASSSHLVVLMFRLSTVGSRTFNVSGPRIWNGLPEDVVSAPTFSTFRRRLKPFRFQQWELIVAINILCCDRST